MVGGGIEEVPGVNFQGGIHEELLSKMCESLGEAIEIKRETARSAAGKHFEEGAL